jgi:hypothetical protein
VDFGTGARLPAGTWRLARHRADLATDAVAIGSTGVRALRTNKRRARNPRPRADKALLMVEAIPWPDLITTPSSDMGPAEQRRGAELARRTGEDR